MTVDIIGIDCATDPADTGIAHATLTPPDGRPSLRYLSVGGRAAGNRTPAQVVSELLTPFRPVVVGLDAPLGWPEAMGRLLREHRAGEELNIEANRLFRRHTDRAVRRCLGKQTLDVGADRIARTAAAALELLSELRRLTNRSFPVATLAPPRFAPSPSEADEAAGPAEADEMQGQAERSETAGAARQIDAAVEVYPRGRLIARYGRSYGKGYRSSSAESLRRSMLEDIAGEMDPLVDVEPAVGDVDLLDAMLCVLGVADVLRGHCTPPEALGVPLDEVAREGWIWLPMS